MKCPCCDAKLSIELTLHDAKAFRAHKISIGMKGSENTKGRPKSIDRNKVKKLRSKGDSLTTIAGKMGISKRSVCNILRELKEGVE